MKQRTEYFRNYYRRNRFKLASMKAWQQKHDLDYRLRAVLRTITQRCDDPRHVSYRWYGGKGIKSFLTFDDLKFLWQRDGADRMKKPSIDREDENGDYTIDNCCFRELSDNMKRAWAGSKRAQRIANIQAGMRRNPCLTNRSTAESIDAPMV